MVSSTVKLQTMIIALVYLMQAVLFGQDFIDVQGGSMTYRMAYQDDEIIYDIWADGFLMASTEVTVSQWREYLGDTGAEFQWQRPYVGAIKDHSPYDHCPILLIRITDIVYYCNWRSQKEGLKPVYLLDGNRIIRDVNADGYRLPTTAEWDYAARGGRLSRGYVYSGSNIPEEVAWFGRDKEEGTMPVGSKKPNELGLFDMSGNAREWTWPDRGIPFPIEESEEVISLRGGGWTSPESSIRLSQHQPAWVFHWANIGFRLAMNAPPTSAGRLEQFIDVPNPGSGK